MTKQYITDGNPDGSVMGQSATEKIAFFNATPVVQQTAGSVAPSTAAGASASTVVASIHSMALAAASLANANRTALVNLGLIA